MLRMALLTLPTFDDAHCTEGVAAIETEKFESSVLMPLANTETVLPALQVFHKGLVIFQSEPLVMMKLQLTVFKVL